MTLVLSERDVEGLIDMKEVVSTVEEAFLREGMGEVANTIRTRSRGSSSVLNVMHANLPYLRRGGLKAYTSSRAGSRFVLILFDTSDSTPLAIMGADILGRYRTGAASGVATKHLFSRSAGTLAIFGSGKQALTQVLGVSAVLSLAGVRVWSPNPDHREAFASRVAASGLEVRTCASPEKAIEGADIASTISSSGEPFLTARMVESVSHINVCGGTVPDHSEIAPDAVAAFDTVVVDDIPQAKVEYRDIIRAVGEGPLKWEDVLDLGSIVAGRRRVKGRTLFKSGGAALEDVSVASLVYDKALRSGLRFPEVELA